jgi:hypothetical protein
VGGERGEDGPGPLDGSPHAARGPALALAALVGIALAAALLGPFGPRAGGAEAAEPRVATSVCEAHELRALQEQDPELQIEIPAQFQLPWPTRAACLSHAAAGDPDAPGPTQPIQFSHKHHAGLYQIDCLYCHSGTDRSRAAGVPSVELCMGCHAQFPASYDELEGIRTLKRHWQAQEPIPWEQVHRLPEHVKFRHNRHVAAGFECQRCHGPVEEMDKLALTADTVWWPWLLPAQKLEMGWCVQCHRENGASQDCTTCHH